MLEKSHAFPSSPPLSRQRWLGEGGGGVWQSSVLVADLRASNTVIKLAVVAKPGGEIEEELGTVGSLPPWGLPEATKDGVVFLRDTS